MQVHLIFATQVPIFATKARRHQFRCMDTWMKITNYKIQIPMSKITNRKRVGAVREPPLPQQFHLMPRPHPETDENLHKRFAQHIGPPRRGVFMGGCN